MENIAQNKHNPWNKVFFLAGTGNVEILPVTLSNNQELFSCKIICDVDPQALILGWLSLN